MRAWRVWLTVALFPLLAAAADDPVTAFDRAFVDETLRVDFYHVGNATEELVTFDRLYRQGAWAGSTTRLVDPFVYGRYRVTALDSETGETLFQKGFDSYFGEYRSTGPALAGVRRTYHESVLLPFPRRPVTLVFDARSRAGESAVIGTLAVDPSDPTIAREAPAGDAVVVAERVSGEPHRRLDLVILGEGYTAVEEPLFRRDLTRFTGVLLDHEPYASLAHLVSVRGVLRPSRQSGCDEPSRGIHRDTSLGASFDALGSSRYLLTEDNRTLRDLAANVPYDAVVVMVNHDRYGGGGLYNLYCVFTAHNQWSDYLLLHELGHAFAGLADEYYTSSVAYNDFYPHGVEPVEPNITALLDPAALKWRRLVAEGTPLPTPWEKAEFDRLDLAYQKQREELDRRIAAASRSGAPAAELAALKAEDEDASRQHADKMTAFLAASAASGEVGAFEGAGYSATGLYRPMVDCIMFSKGVRPFCKVCESAIAAMVHRYAD
jgi:hypothetical protein